MALPIKPTPSISGKDSERFHKILDKTEKISEQRAKKEREELEERRKIHREFLKRCNLL